MAVQRRASKPRACNGVHPFIVVSAWASVTGREYIVEPRRNNRGFTTGIRRIVLVDPIDIDRAHMLFGKWRTLRAFRRGELVLNSTSLPALPE